MRHAQRAPAKSCPAGHFMTTSENGDWRGVMLGAAVGYRLALPASRAKIPISRQYERFAYRPANDAHRPHDLAGILSALYLARRDARAAIAGGNASEQSWREPTNQPPPLAGDVLMKAHLSHDFGLRACNYGDTARWRPSRHVYDAVAWRACLRISSNQY